MKKILQLSEAAELLRTSSRTVRRLIDDGELEGLKVRGGCRVTTASVDAYIMRQVLKFTEESPYRFGVTDRDRS